MAKITFVDGDKNTGTPGTIVLAAWLNKIFGKNGHQHDGKDADGSAPLIHEPVGSKSGAYTLTDEDGVVLCDATAGSFIVTLPPAAGLAGRRYHIKKVDSSSNAVTIDGDGAETIDGDATVAITAQWTCLTVVCDGYNWFIL